MPDAAMDRLLCKAADPNLETTKHEDPMKRDHFDHGFSEAVWSASKEEAREAMIQVAQRQRTFFYSDLVQRITSCHLEPQDSRLAHMLGEISTEEDEAGRGLLTVVVVHKTGDQRPGQGFFELAQQRGRDISDKERCWVEELKKVHKAWT